LVRLVESGQLEPCRAIDLGCGIGENVIYLAQQGFVRRGRFGSGGEVVPNEVKRPFSRQFDIETLEALPPGPPPWANDAIYLMMRKGEES
jgi:hypothetical protein